MARLLLFHVALLFRLAACIKLQLFVSFTKTCETLSVEASTNLANFRANSGKDLGVLSHHVDTAVAMRFVGAILQLFLQGFKFIKVRLLDHGINLSAG